MLDVDFRDSRLQKAASSLAMKGGHRLVMWERDRKYHSRGFSGFLQITDTYTSYCKFCGFGVVVSCEREEPMVGTALSEPCMVIV